MGHKTQKALKSRAYYGHKIKAKHKEQILAILCRQIKEQHLNE